MVATRRCRFIMSSSRYPSFDAAKLLLFPQLTKQIK